MELVSLFWRAPQDVHLMRARSGPLDLAGRLNVNSRPSSTSPALNEDLTEFLSNHPDAECTYKPTFKSTLNPITHDYEGFGVKVNARTGVVIAEANPSAHPLYNFTVLATIVANRHDAASPRRKAYLRIHLHNYVAKAWLSPSRLKIPKNIGSFVFALYAQFDDKTIIEMDTQSVGVWTSDPPDKVDPDWGFLRIENADVDDTDINITAFLKPEFKDQSGGDITARGIAVPYTLPQIAQLIPNSAGYDRRNEVPNFLFLADGFQSGDETKFNSMIDHFITSLRQDGKFKPFDRLVDRMNFWKVFVPSVARGIGTKYELYGGVRAKPIPEFNETFEIQNDSPTSEDDLNLDQWGPNQVRFYFGLPTLEHVEMSNGDIKEYWKQISRLPPGLINEVENEFITEWKQMGDRRMVNNIDTFIGMTFGRSTKAKAMSGDDATSFRPIFERLQRYRLNRFLVELQYRDEGGGLHPIGPVWDIDHPASGGTEPAGKDWDNVIILLCSNWGRAQNTSGQLYVNVISDERDYIAIELDTPANDGFPGGRAVKVANLEADRLSDDLPLLPGKSTLIHEIGHSLGLDDEYGELGITKESSLFQFSGTGNIDYDKHYSNVQAKSDLVDFPGEESINAEKVKWRWHRIEKSAVLAPLVSGGPAAITHNGDQYTIKVRSGQAAAFVEDETVFLRRRKPGESILKDIDYDEISPSRYPMVTRSPELVVHHINPTENEVVVTARNFSSLTGHDLVADFPADCVLYKPLPARGSSDEFPAAGEFLELTAANILRFMDDTGRPLHEKRDNLLRLDLDFEAEQSPVLVDITIAMCAKKNKNIVGLYAGGDQYHHGIYHPAGHCIMRNGLHIAEFCSVCKYIITDYIDPSLHPEVDVLIEEYYPLKEEDPGPPLPF